ncbi:DENN domain-containing protein 2A, putative [Pediculus humanus corporis]|uniref:DENN domain-containing protein 2A, putative n=1 Tax=Pediculus humanus subsp. corporis TaxID=121224 RepID=E0VPZ0_PEDHC|nr:DENN domain-containing protein 2A, putative [Pediculus humanus corporis]EEB15446.1 DENN domain-containing protein 2A, putative [Pediculus humanus corporis]
MSNHNLKCQSRVESIKKKFECSPSEKITIDNNFVQDNNYSLYSNQNSNDSRSKSEIVLKVNNNFNKTDSIISNNCNSKIQIKRSPAFRREKLKTIKTLGKFPSQKKEKSIYYYSSNCVKKIDDNLDTFEVGKSKKIENDSDNVSLPVDNTSMTTISYAVVNKPKKVQKNEKKLNECNLKLSDSLKKALQSPLPKGPPPKKPPRTFSYDLVNDKSTTSSKLHKLDKSLSSKEISKLQLKLKKLEIALKVHDKNFDKKLGNNGFNNDDIGKFKDPSLQTNESQSLPPSSSQIKDKSLNCFSFQNCFNLDDEIKYKSFFTNNDESHLEYSKTESDNCTMSENSKTLAVDDNFEFIHNKDFNECEFEENKNFDKCSHVSLRKREEEKNSKESDGEVNSNFDTQNKILGNITRNQEKTEESNGDTFSKSNFADKASYGLLHYVPYWKTIKKNEFSRLFECCLLVGLTLESQKNVPYIKNIFPPNAKPPPLIEALCFPDAGHWPPKLEKEEREEQCYSLVITNENGERKFGYCRRVLPEGSDLCLPLIYCIVTSHRADGFFYKVLYELESRHGSQGIDDFIAQLHEAPFPGPGESLKLKQILEEATKVLSPAKDKNLGSTLVRRPCDTRLEEKNLTQLFQYLELQVFFKIFASLLHERKILLISTSIRKLSTCIEALQSTLLPFCWQHTCIPVLPIHLLEICEAPTPYVIGLLKTENVHKSLSNINFENGIIVDLDDSKVIKSCGDEDVLMCSKLLKSLKISLNLAINSTVLPDNSRNVILSDALIDFFVENCGHYSNFIVAKENEKIFQVNDFIKHSTSTISQTFLNWFTKTSLFQGFIHERINQVPEDVSVKLFNKRATESSCLDHHIKNSAPLANINYKVFNKKVKTLGDKIKDFIQ